MKKFPVVILCGSIRDKQAFEDVQTDLTLEGNIVISVGVFDHFGDREVKEGANGGTKTNTEMMLYDMDRRKIDMSDSIFIVNPDGYIGENTWSHICYARMLDKQIDSLSGISEREIDNRVQEHIEIAEKLAWEQIDFIRHSNNYYILDNFVHFKHKGKEIVDPWINVETHYNGIPWADHKNPEEGVNPFEYYGKKKVAAFIEEIILRRDC